MLNGNLFVVLRDQGQALDTEKQLVRDEAILHVWSSAGILHFNMEVSLDNLVNSFNGDIVRGNVFSSLHVLAKPRIRESIVWLNVWDKVVVYDWLHPVSHYSKVQVDRMGYFRWGVIVSENMSRACSDLMIKLVVISKEWLDGTQIRLGQPRALDNGGDNTRTSPQKATFNTKHWQIDGYRCGKHRTWTWSDRSVSFVVVHETALPPKCTTLEFVFRFKYKYDLEVTCRFWAGTRRSPITCRLNMKSLWVIG